MALGVRFGDLGWIRAPVLDLIDSLGTCVYIKLENEGLNVVFYFMYRRLAFKSLVRFIFLLTVLLIIPSLYEVLVCLL